jgi:hypothetical protein
MMCPLHRKILLILNSTDGSKLKQNPRNIRERVSSRVVARKVVNKNPNCNHNSSSIFNNQSFNNIRYDNIKGEKSAQNDDNKDLLWANGDQYSEKDEIRSLKDLLIRLFHEPYFGEKRMTPTTKSVEKSSVTSDVKSLYGEFEKYFGHEEILIDGYKINKYSLWIVKKLNPHHKAFIYSLIDSTKVSSRTLVKDVLNECINMNNKWNKDCYI